MIAIAAEENTALAQGHLTLLKSLSWLEIGEMQILELEETSNSFYAFLDSIHSLSKSHDRARIRTQDRWLLIWNSFLYIMGYTYIFIFAFWIYIYIYFLFFFCWWCLWFIPNHISYSWPQGELFMLQAVNTPQPLMLNTFLPTSSCTEIAVGCLFPTRWEERLSSLSFPGSQQSMKYIKASQKCLWNWTSYRLDFKWKE